MYDDEAMKRRLVKGDVGEALFRRWFDKNVGHLENIRLVHWGYYPLGVVKDEEKRKLLKQQSDPDYALVRGNAPNKPLRGISVNSQSRPYDIRSTMGGDCIKCPRSTSCYDGNEQNLWYNEFNIRSDYTKFSQQNGVEVALASLIVGSLNTVAQRVSEGGLEQVVHDYVQGGEEAVDDKDGLAAFLKQLEKRERVKNFRWLLHSEVRDGKVSSFITGGWSNRGRPRLVYCVDMKLSRDQKSFVQSVRGLDVR